jgi:alkylation response protein AidB-like acyl-CoA dehydrogenase
MSELAAQASLLPQDQPAQELERFLGDPRDSSQPFSFARSFAHDEAETLPYEACALLTKWGLQQFYIPEALGGRLSSFEQVGSLMRTVARRDLTVAWSHGLNTLFGAIHPWLWGSAGQQAQVAQAIAEGGCLAVGYHERGHGNDLLGIELSAEPTNPGYRLTGEKWVIGNATRCEVLTLFARTRSQGGPRGFSLLLVDKRELDPANYELIPRVRTLGVRGSDVSGIRFKGAALGATALIGAEGGGFEQTLKGFQVTRSLVSALLLGTADMALRSTLSFAVDRSLYGTTVVQLPYPRDLLAGAFADLLACECLSRVALRALHTVPAQTTITAAVTKYVVPTTIGAALRALSVVLGARHYLRAPHETGMFQKLLRDSAIATVGHMSSVVNLQSIGQQLRACAERRSQRRTAHPTPPEQRVELMCALRRELPAFDPTQIAISARGQDDLLAGFLALAPDDLLRGAADRHTAELLVALGRALRSAIDEHDQLVLDAATRRGAHFAESPACFLLAKRFCALFTAASCILVWHHNRETLGGFFADGEWLALALHRLLAPLRVALPALPPAITTGVMHALLTLHREHKSFALAPLRLAGEVSSGRSGQR